MNHREGDMYNNTKREKSEAGPKVDWLRQSQTDMQHYNDTPHLPGSWPRKYDHSTLAVDADLQGTQNDAKTITQRRQRRDELRQKHASGGLVESTKESLRNGTKLRWESKDTYNRDPEADQFFQAGEKWMEEQQQWGPIRWADMVSDHMASKEYERKYNQFFGTNDQSPERNH